MLFELSRVGDEGGVDLEGIAEIIGDILLDDLADSRGEVLFDLCKGFLI